MKAFLLSALILLCLVTKAQQPADWTLPIATTLIPDSNKVRFSWINNNGATMQVFRKPANSSTWGAAIGSVPATAQQFTDSITPGLRYEYQFKVTRTGFTPGFSYSYLTVGIEAAPVHYKGKALVIVDTNFVVPLKPEIDRLKLDLICEGWMVAQLKVEPYYPVDSVKAWVRAWYEEDTISHHAIILLGHVPIPYSGDIAPDGHSDHRGAWPADVYYGDMSHAWTDVSVNIGSATRIQNRNYIGDGKFDNTWLQGLPEIAVGRVDFNDMPLFGLNHEGLLRQYLNKDHNYRTKAFTVRNKVLVDDNFGYFSQGESFAQNAYRAGYSLCGKDSVIAADMFWDANSYLFSYGCGAGSWQSASGVGATADIIWVDSLRSVFTMLFGSYFGDFDNQNNLLRAPIATPGYTLTSCWAGRGHWFFHTMNMGYPLSYSVINSQFNNHYLPAGSFSAGIHTALMGDPTLALNPIYQPQNLALQQDTAQTGQVVNLSWDASADVDVLGYYVYRATTLTDSFQLITPQYVNALTFTDNNAAIGNNVYMVRPVKLQNTLSGTYYNVGIGVLDSLTTVAIVDTNTIGLYEDLAKHVTVYPNPSNGSYTIKNAGSSGIQLELYNTVGALVWQRKMVNTFEVLDISSQASGVYYLKITGAKGESGFKKLVKY